MLLSKPLLILDLFTIRPKKSLIWALQKQTSSMLDSVFTKLFFSWHVHRGALSIALFIENWLHTCMMLLV